MNTAQRWNVRVYISFPIFFICFFFGEPKDEHQQQQQSMLYNFCIRTRLHSTMNRSEFDGLVKCIHFFQLNKNRTHFAPSRSFYKKNGYWCRFSIWIERCPKNAKSWCTSEFQFSAFLASDAVNTVPGCNLKDEQEIYSISKRTAKIMGFRRHLNNWYPVILNRILQEIVQKPNASNIYQSTTEHHRFVVQKREIGREFISIL